MIMKPAKCGTENLLVTKITAQPFTIMDNPLLSSSHREGRKEQSPKGYFGFTFSWNTPTVRSAGTDETDRGTAL